MILWFQSNDFVIIDSVKDFFGGLNMSQTKQDLLTIVVGAGALVLPLLLAAI